MLKKALCAFVLASLGLVGAVSAGEKEAGKKKNRRAEEPVQIKVVAVGPTQEDFDRAKASVVADKFFQKELAGASYSILGIEYVEFEDKSKPTTLPTRFRATVYDYTNDRTLIAQGSFDGSEQISVHEEFFQPPSSPEEFERAISIVQQAGKLGADLKSQTLRAYPPMPPTTILDGTNERLINIGLSSLDSLTSNEVIGVSLKRGVVVRYENNAPPTAKAAPEACGIPASGGSSSRQAGQYQMTVSQNGTNLWEFLVLRPGASSGTMASGIELRDVKYRGKSVFKRAHAPVLNVSYVNGACGPYRDWQYQESDFQVTPGFSTPAPGVAIAPPGGNATTALDTGVDAGNFRGVAIYTQNNETVLISEMTAGWYRYIMEWRLANDGTIRPRYGFGATDNSCVCLVHTHHVYWRFDFDIVQPNNKVFQIERGRKFQTPIATELTRLRNYGTNRSLMIQNGNGNEAYTLVPNVTDGVTDNYGRSDFWVLRAKNVVGGTVLQNEIDDGWSSIGGNCTATSGSCININPFINGESVDNQDIVVWYGAHFIHSDGANLLDPDRSGANILSNSHVVGPEIRPVRW